MATITELWRFPVKSMQGERIDAVDLTPSGVAGDRRWAIVDSAEGLVASAKNPRKWGALLQFAARTDGDEVEITTPDGTVTRSDSPTADAVLSAALAREVKLAKVAPDGASYEMLFPAIDGLAPDEFVAATRTGDDEEGIMTKQALGTGFCDVAPLHVVSTATLAALGADSRRLRANVVVDTGGDAYEENGWSSLTLGPASAAVFMATMRCVMTTLAQPGLDVDRALLQQLAKENRVELGGMGVWACAGVYASVTQTGRVAVGHTVALGATN